MFVPLSLRADNGCVILGDMKMGQRIREAREAAQLTQAQVADACQVSPQAVSAWETGRAKKIEGESLFRLADVLRVSARYLATGQQTGKISKTISDELMTDLGDLSLEKQKIVLDLIRSLRAE